MCIQKILVIFFLLFLKLINPQKKCLTFYIINKNAGAHLQW